MFDSFGKLVGTRGAFEAAVDAFQFGNDILCLHAFHQSGDALRVAVATSVELYVFQNAILDFKLDGLTAGALGSISVSHQAWKFMVMLTMTSGCSERPTGQLSAAAHNRAFCFSVYSFAGKLNTMSICPMRRGSVFMVFFTV